MNSAMNTLRDAVQSGQARLAAGPHPERARQDASALLRAVIGKDQAALMAHWDEPLTARFARRFAAFVERRFKGEPMQYILRQVEFYGLSLHVTPLVLIPRPETEHLVEAAIDVAHHWPQPHIADVGTGSGAIAIALAIALPTSRITAIDCSLAALAVARENAKRHGLGDRVRFVDGDLLIPVSSERFEIVVSNPPYIPIGDRENLAVEVREYEPAMALFAGEDGLDIYRNLIPAAWSVLVAEGRVMLEIGFGQAAAVRQLLEETGFKQVDFISDLQGIPRVALGVKESHIFNKK